MNKDNFLIEFSALKMNANQKETISPSEENKVINFTKSDHHIVENES